jgi:S-adenosylmethionine-diacylgycerolhomoserine-N-methlytransferase
MMTDNLQSRSMERYYQFHARVYDLTRWTFLFGRRAIIRQLNLQKEAKLHILEVGCGTGFNLSLLANQYPNCLLTGVDVSGDMLAQAAKNTAFWKDRVTLVRQPYGTGEKISTHPPDIILFSYALTMFNPGYLEAIEQAKKDLIPGGLIAVVDFNDTPSPWFRRWMQFNHVRMETHLLPVLDGQFSTLRSSIIRAYGGWWTYFMYTGIKKD